METNFQEEHVFEQDLPSSIENSKVSDIYATSQLRNILTDWDRHVVKTLQ